MPAVNCITISEASKLVQSGYSTEAPAIAHVNGCQPLFDSAEGILRRLVGNMKFEVIHDDNWREFPHIGQALKPCGLEETCYAVAMCPSLSRWALGVSANRRNRESAAILALSMAVGPENQNLQAATAEFPHFHQLCKNLGVVS